MSSILKAIRKIEDDKRAKDNQSPDLMVDHGQSAPRQKPVVMMLGVGMIVGAVIAGLLFYALTGSNNDPAPAAIVEGQAEAPKDQPLRQTIPSEVRFANTESSVQDNGDELSQQAEAGEAINDVVKPLGTLAQGNPSTEKESAALIEPPSSTESRGATKTKVMEPEPSPENPQETTSGFVVSEIVYVDDQGASMAVVNDLPVMVGTYVDESIVQSISRNSVTFKGPVKSFTIPVKSE